MSPDRSRPLPSELVIEDLVEKKTNKEDDYNPLEITPRGKKVQAEGRELL